MNMVIIKAGEHDYDDVRAFYHSVIDGMRDSQFYIGWEKDIYPAPEFLKESIENGELYICLDDGKIVSAMVLNDQCNESYNKFNWQTDASESELMVIHALGVLPDYAGKGYAKAMVRESIRIAEETGIKAIRLDVLEGNLPAEKLYEGFGFKYMATLEMFYEDTGWTNFKLYEYVV